MFRDFQRNGKQILVTLGALFVLAVATPAYAQLGLGMVPMRAELSMKPGQQYSGSLKLSSQSGQSVRIRGEALDFYIDESTTPQFERNLPQEVAVSCKKWLSLNPTELEIDKDGFLNVRYTLRPPADLPEGSYACAAGFTTLSPADQTAEGIGMRMAVRIVAAIYVTIGAPAVDGGLKEIKLESVPAAAQTEPALRAVVVMQNQGKMYYRPTGKLEILDAAGKVIETSDFPSLAVLRERDQRFLFPIKTHLAPGQYKLRARVDIGTNEIQQGSMDVVIDPPSPDSPHASTPESVAAVNDGMQGQR